MSRRTRKKLPEPVVVNVESLSHEGRGVSHIDGKTVFIDGGMPGETVRIRYLSRHSRYDEAQVEEIITASPQRVIPGCGFFDLCGGCSLQHIDPAFQVSHKQGVLLEQLKYTGGIEPEEVLQPLTGPVWGYRHKARLGVKNVIKKGRVLVGFREKRKPYIADIDSCVVMHPDIGNRLVALSELVQSLSIKSRIPQIEAAVGENRTAIVIRHLDEPDEADIERLREFSEAGNIDIYLQGNKGNVTRVMRGDGMSLLSYRLDRFGIDIDFSPLDFTQVNFIINREMVARVVDLLSPQVSGSVLDLFCGLGNFTLPLATRSTRVTGIDVDEGLIRKARLNAGKNRIENVDFLAQDLYGDNPGININASKYESMLLDPPRSGAREIIESLDLKNITRIVYVSCNPATLARDAGILARDKGFKLARAGIMDMFPHTSHVESVAVFDR